MTRSTHVDEYGRAIVTTTFTPSDILAVLPQVVTREHENRAAKGRVVAFRPKQKSGLGVIDVRPVQTD
jgi:hypothetical protein